MNPTDAAFSNFGTWFRTSRNKHKVSETNSNLSISTGGTSFKSGVFARVVNNLLSFSTGQRKEDQPVPKAGAKREKLFDLDFLDTVVLETSNEAVCKPMNYFLIDSFNFNFENYTLITNFFDIDWHLKIKKRKARFATIWRSKSGSNYLNRLSFFLAPSEAYLLITSFPGRKWLLQNFYNQLGTHPNLIRLASLKVLNANGIMLEVAFKEAPIKTIRLPKFCTAASSSPEHTNCRVLRYDTLPKTPIRLIQVLEFKEVKEQDKNCEISFDY